MLLKREKKRELIASLSVERRTLNERAARKPRKERVGRAKGEK